MLLFHACVPFGNNFKFQFSRQHSPFWFIYIKLQHLKLQMMFQQLQTSEKANVIQRRFDISPKLPLLFKKRLAAVALNQASCWQHRVQAENGSRKICTYLKPWRKGRKGTEKFYINQMVTIECGGCVKQQLPCAILRASSTLLTNPSHISGIT